MGGADFLFEVAGTEVSGRNIGPGDGERVRCPEADGGNGEEDMLTWFEGPGAREAKGDAHGVSGENFNISVSATAATIAVDEG